MKNKFNYTMLLSFFILLMQVPSQNIFAEEIEEDCANPNSSSYLDDDSDGVADCADDCTDPTRTYFEEIADCDLIINENDSCTIEPTNSDEESSQLNFNITSKKDVSAFSRGDIGFSCLTIWYNVTDYESCIAAVRHRAGCCEFRINTTCGVGTMFTPIGFMCGTALVASCAKAADLACSADYENGMEYCEATYNPPTGCTNPAALNYDSNATKDDKSCEMCQDEDGDGECAQTTDACDNDATRTTTNSEGYCEDDYYCENPEAINYGDIGACHLIEEYICTDEDSDGTCAEEGDECDQDSGFTLKNNDGECAEERYCTDPSAENYGSVGDCQMPPDDTDPEVYE